MTDELTPSPSFPLPPGKKKEEGKATSDAQRLARLRWRARRGMLELDVLLKKFLDVRYAALTPDEVDAFERLLTTPDDILLTYLQGGVDPREPELMRLVEQIRN